jgi:hypothetical protein
MKPNFSDEDIISTYSRAQAIQDGVLVNITTNYPKEAKLFRYPVAFTRAVFALIEGSAKDIFEHQSTVVWDILYMSIHLKVEILSEAEHLFSVLIGSKTHILKAVCSGGDQGEPVITILLPEED